MKNAESHYTDVDGNQISTKEKYIVGFILIPLICISITLIIALWPDRIPASNDNFQSYCKIKLFKVRVIAIPNAVIEQVNQGDLYSKYLNAQKKPSYPGISKADSSKVTRPPVKDTKALSEQEKLKQEQIKQAQIALLEKARLDKQSKAEPPLCCRMPVAGGTAEGVTPAVNQEINSGPLDIEAFNKLSSLNALFLILVVIGGFLGNLIHITSSFTNFIGSGQFKRSWLLWYIAKPFIASGLALAVYFALCGGFLSINNSANNINIVGVMTVSILAGLFADRTTLKLKEVFEVLLRPKEERADPMIADPKATTVSPLILSRQRAVDITITGENFIKERLVLLINNEVVDMAVSPRSIVVNYAAPVGLDEVLLVLKTDKGVILIQKQLVVM